MARCSCTSCPSISSRRRRRTRFHTLVVDPLPDAVALARMPLAEAGHAFRVRVAQRLGGLAGRIVHGHAFPGHGAAHAVQVRRGTPTSPSRRPCRPRTARPSRLRRCLPGLRRRPPKRCRRSGLRPMSSWRRAGPASFAFRYCLRTQCSVSFQRSICRCSPHSRWGRTGEQIPSEHFTCPAVDKRRYRIRFRHPPAMQPRFRACRVGHFPGRLRIRKRDPEGSLEKKSHLNQW